MKNESKSSKKLILIDGNAIIHRAYHALPPLTTKSGELVNAVYGFTSTLLSVIEKFKPDYVAASFDLKGPTFRHEKFVEYKANRVKADDELYAQIPRVKDVVRAFNIPIYEKAGFEADDVIGTLARQAGELKDGIETIIVTGDMDTLQLIDDDTKVYTMRRGLSDAIIYDAQSAAERYGGLMPSQLIDYKGLRGDPSDNIPGVKGIGEKTAIALLTDFKTVEGVYENIEKVKGAVREKLERDKAQALLSKELATIDRNAPVELDINATKIHEFDRAKLVKLFGELNFYSLVKRLPRPGDADPQEKSIIPAKSSGKGVQDIKYEICDDKTFENVAKDLQSQKELSLVPDVRENVLKGIAFSWKTGRATYVPFTASTSKRLAEILENNSIAKIGYDLKLSYKMLAKENIRLAGIYFDAMIAAYVLDPGKPIALSTLAITFLGEELEPEKKGKQLSMLDLVDEDVFFQETCKRADYIFKLKNPLQKQLDAISDQQTSSGSPHSVQEVFAKIEMPLVEILADMEIAGITLDTLIFKGISEKLTARLSNLEKSIHDLAGAVFNINSPSQLAGILFETLELPTINIKKGKTGYSTAAGELEKLRPEHKIIEKIEEYRELFKLKTTYLDALPLLVDGNSRIHTTFKQAVTATGRLSSADPNLQNIPIKTELGQLLRTAFVANEGNALISGDYSQIDLRCVAHVSGDKKMIEAFHRGDDIHKLTAAEVNKVTPSQVTDKMRSSAKALNFGIIYGMGAFGFSQSAGISREEAQLFINTYMEKFSGVAKYMKEMREFAHTNGYVETLFGRRRNLPEIKSPNFQVANGAERMAINMPIQGLAADIVKIAMLKVAEAFENQSDVKMLLQIHDEIILEAPSKKAEEIAQKMKEIMEHAVILSVPLVVSVNIGDNWGEI
jgi:DNA polymerase I